MREVEDAGFRACGVSIAADWMISLVAVVQRVGGSHRPALVVGSVLFGVLGQNPSLLSLYRYDVTFGRYRTP